MSYIKIMNIYQLHYIHFMALSDGIGWGTLLGFCLVLLLLLLILKQGKPRIDTTVVTSQSPQDWTDDPEYAENRRKSAAAAFAYHLHESSTSSST